MKKIETLRLEGLKLSEEMAYYYFVVSAVAVYTVIANMFEKVFNRFKEAYDYQDELYQRIDRKRLSKEVQEKALARDKWFRKLRNNVREVLEFGNNQKIQAAEVLSETIDEYGGAKIPTLTVEAETGVLLNLYSDLMNKYAAQLELLGLTSVVEGAKQANDEFIEAQNARTQSDADYGKNAMADARVKTARLYRNFIDVVNIEADEDSNGILTPFIDYMNVKVEEMRRLAGQAPAPSGSGSGSDSDNTSRFATFEFANGESTRRKIEVGTIIPFPDNTAGMVWRPQVKDGLMPNRNIIFREVPIEEAEYTAVFHFLDHHDEEIRQPAGTALVAPQNTDGCHWDPTVPATMPAEDTQYYEVLTLAPDEGEGGEGGGSGSTGGGGVIYPGEPGEDTDL